MSVLNQTMGNFEHIIIDDANDPETEKIVTAFDDSRIRFSRHEFSKGASGGYNTGLSMARGKYIVTLGDDDEFYPTYLEKVLSTFSSAARDIGFVWTGYARIMDDESGEKIIASRIWPRVFRSKEDGVVEATSIGNGYGVCIKRECFDQIGNYDESLAMGADTDLLFRLAQSYNFQTVPEVLVKIHHHNNAQLTGKNHNPERLRIREQILKRYESFMHEFPRLHYVHYKSVVDLCYMVKEKEKGRKLMFSLMKKRPFRLLNIPDLFFYELTGKDTAGFFR
jgi:glycosyltransferase involved in cell wall biosynthesis